MTAHALEVRPTGPHGPRLSTASRVSGPRSVRRAPRPGPVDCRPTGGGRVDVDAFAVLR
jgi:hypothetical protein